MKNHTDITDQPKHPLRALFLLFFKLGLIGFGGPAAHIAMMEREVVTQRRWLSRQHFMDLLAATNLVPGPNSTEMAIHIGYVRTGYVGAIVSGAAFVFPAFCMVLALSIAYVQYGALPEVGALLYGIKPAVVAIILSATWRLGRSAIKNPLTVGIFASGVAAMFFEVNQLWVLVGGGLIGILVPQIQKQGHIRLWLVWLPAILNPQIPAFAQFSTDNRLWRLGLFFLKVGALLFGSGYVLVAFIEREVVAQYGWLTPDQLLDAIAIGQMTPGPVLTTATFIGYLVAGLPGAIVATTAIFAPSFLIVMAMGPWIPRLRQSPLASAFLNGVNPAVVAVILVTAFHLARAAMVDIPTLVIGLVALAGLLRFRVDSLWLIVGSGLAGLAVNALFSPG